MELKHPGISVVIPTLNEEGNIKPLVGRLADALEKRGAEYELIFVDDHSTDRTRENIKDLENKYPISLYLKKGQTGKAQSLLEGFSYARCE
ncbi:MAG: dolichol-phosphate mannosyltransferase, partial [Parcubacteria group bacterium Gr01-1014_24]